MIYIDISAIQMLKLDSIIQTCSNLCMYNHFGIEIFSPQ